MKVEKDEDEEVLPFDKVFVGSAPEGEDVVEDGSESSSSDVGVAGGVGVGVEVGVGVGVVSGVN